MDKVAGRIQELFSYLTSVKDINRGGCLFAAFAVFKVLQKEGLSNDDLVIVQLDAGMLNISTNQMFINGQTDEVRSSNHFVLSPDGGKTLYHTGGLFETESSTKYNLVIPNDKVETFCETALHKANWNKKFKRTRGVKEINFMLGTEIPNFRKNYGRKLARNKN